VFTEATVYEALLVSFGETLRISLPGQGRVDRSAASNYDMASLERHRMQLIAPDILTEARGLSVPFCAAGIIIGLLLWLFGWRWHRFWVVLATTIVAGLIGLSGHAVIGPRMLAAGLLLAIAAGMLAIDLSRLVAFSAAGLGCWLIVHKVLPNFQEPTICLLGGGILGLLLYRLQLMILSGLVGTIIFGHSLLLLVEKLSEPYVTIATWSQANFLGLNIAVVVVALLGVAVQGQIERWRAAKGPQRQAWYAPYLSREDGEFMRQLPNRRGLQSLFGR